MCARHTETTARLTRSERGEAAALALFALSFFWVLATRTCGCGAPEVTSSVAYRAPREDGSGLTAEGGGRAHRFRGQDEVATEDPPERPRPAPRGLRDGLAPARQRTSSAASSVPTTATLVVS